MNWTLLLASLILASFSWTFISIIQNYLTARNIDLPIVISPVSPLNPIWILTWRTFPSVLSLRHLPFGLGKWTRCTYMGWTFQDKHALHDELGPVFVIVTPGGNEVIVADPDAAHIVLSRRKEFIKPAIMYDQLNVFGRNLNTVEGEDWQRQRRLTAPNFNEKTSSLVWDEAARQAQDMAKSWTDQGSAGTKETVADTATLALHVLTSVGFGLAYPFHAGVRELPKGHRMTYRDALSLCLQNIITFAIFPKRMLKWSFLPAKLRTLGLAVKEFQLYMEEMLTHERNMAAKREHGTGNLIGSLVRASEEDRKSGEQQENNPAARLGLTDEEIFGNIFAFNLAGHETTANTLATAIVLLAAKPQYQTWLAKEMKAVAPIEDGKYEEAFPKLQRCLAVMYETLRLYGSIVFIPKSTGFHTQSLTSRGKSHVLPPNTGVSINVQALHTDPQIWGDDSLTWRPERWLPMSQPQSFIEPKAGTYVPWADGPRACVGKKFSQVEFVAVLATLFSQYRARPILSGEEGEAVGRKALLDMVEDSSISYITLQMREPRRRGLIWERSP
ncbi:hypothetical protein ACLMJK_002016 [Lecanora helva]